jgi:hypothetical protein
LKPQKSNRCLIPCTRFILIAVLGLVLNACGGGGEDDSGNSSTDVNGVSGSFGVFNAATNGATCILTDTTETVVTTQITGTDGRVSFDNIDIPIGLVVLSCQGGSYLDEATGLLVNPAPDLHASANYAGGSLQLIATSLSELAYQLANADSDLSDIREQTQNVATIFGLDGIDFMTIVPDDLNSNAVNDDSAGRIAIVLAAISQLSDSNNISPSGVVSALFADISGFDGSSVNSINSTTNNLITVINALSLSEMGASTNLTNSSEAMASLIASLNLQNANVAPNANAGVDQNVGATAIVSLNSSASSDIDGSLASYAWTQSSGTSVSLSSSSVESPTFDVSIANDNGESLVFSLIVTDNEGASSVADTVSIAVAELQNQAPIASAGSLNTTEDVVANGVLQAQDPNDDSLTFSIVTPPTKGSLQIDNNQTGAYTYIPDSNQSGSDQFSFAVSDGIISSNTATTFVQIEAVNDQPSAFDASFDINAETTITGNLTASDIEGDSLAFSVINSPSQGQVQITNAMTGTFSYTSSANAAGQDTFTFHVNDGNHDSNIATVTFNITSLPTTPGNFTATGGDGEIALSWDPVNSAESYTLYWDTESGVDRQSGQAISAITSFSYLHEGLARAQTYFYRIAANSQSGESMLSEEHSATTITPLSVSAPDNTSASPADGAVELSWDPVDGASSYNVYLATDQSVNPTNYLSLNDNQKVSDIISSIVFVSGLSNYETYYFTVTASNSVGESGGSITVSSTPMREDYLYMNNIRADAELNGYKRNAELETAALNHSQYQVTNEILGHDESASNSGFTGVAPSDRAKAAGYDGYFSVGEVIAYDDTEQKSLDSLMSAIYHRFSLLRNDADDIGFGFFKDTTGGLNQSFVGNNANSKLSELCSGEDFIGFGTSYTLCDPTLKIEASVYESARDYFTGSNPDLVIWPANNASGVQPVFYEEAPDPLPDYSASGYPISAEFNTTNVVQVDLISFELFINDSGEQITNIRLLTQSTDPNSLFSSHQFSLFPLDRLDYNTTYRVDFSYVQDGLPIDKSWIFTTLDLGTVVYKINALADELEVNSGETFHVYLPPTQLNPSMGGYSVSSSFSSELVAEFVDSNTLEITFTGAVDDQASFSLNNGGTFSIRILKRIN